MAKPKRVRKVKIPKNGAQHISNLENKYKHAMLDMLADLFPERDYDKNPLFDRMAVTDIVNPVNGNKEYGILFICNNTLFSIVEAFDNNLDAAIALGIEGLATGMSLCDQAKRFHPAYKYKDLKLLVYENQPKDLKNQIIQVSKNDISTQPIVLRLEEMKYYNKIFRSSIRGTFPAFIFNPHTNPEASKYFELSKEILKEIPNTRVPRI